VRVGILGASGYTGVELLRLLASHPRAQVSVLTSSQRTAGQAIGNVFPHLLVGAGAGELPDLVTHEEVGDWRAAADVVFCCLPHATTQEIIRRLPLDDGLRVVDLSADFRLRDVDVYREWYGGEHAAKELQREAVYGLCELNREAVRGARLVANPGCCTCAAANRGHRAPGPVLSVAAA
jgi:N-acetyl-gamma-glutamyl-phosphate reductase